VRQKERKDVVLELSPLLFLRYLLHKGVGMSSQLAFSIFSPDPF
jgi:hypothetical protein